MGALHLKFRELLKVLQSQNILHQHNEFLSIKESVAQALYKNESPQLFTNTECTSWQVAGGIYSQRQYLAMGLECTQEQMLQKLSFAFEHPSKAEVVQTAPCQEVIEHNIDLEKLPIPLFLPKDGGHYITAGVMIVKDKEYGLNACYHRLMRISKNRFTMRMVEGRHTHQAYLKNNHSLEAAVCLGNSAAVLIAASMSPKEDVFEMDIANTLEPTPLVKCITKDLLVPADCEIVLEGRILAEQEQEGPFVDLTGTYDFRRTQPIFEIDCITYRKNPILQILLPGKQEHKILMGMPKEPMIFNKVSHIVDCKNVVLTPGGGCWLHAAIQIHKKAEDDGKKALQVAFQTHKSLKHAIVVDEDVNIYDSNAIEWALATRFQADRDLIVLEDQPSSSLDPSAKHVLGEKSKTAKMGFDATIPLSLDRNKFIPVQ